MLGCKRRPRCDTRFRRAAGITGRRRRSTRRPIGGQQYPVLTGLLDRSALYGVLAEVEALGLDLLEVRQLTPKRKSSEPGDRRSP